MRTAVTGGRRARRLAVCVVVLALLAAVGIALDRAYLQPKIDRQLQPADAIVVLGGNPYERFEHGLRLAERGLARQVVLSNSVGAEDTRMQELCARTITGVQITCFLPQPWTTRGEAQEVQRLASARGWNDIIVVTTTAHLERARFILERCYDKTLQMTDFPESRGAAETVFGWGYQSAGWLKALYQTGC
ncbi:YdcF family protein [Tsukamurella paurometabola]|uniref:YdcF family protein n=1 Tax=Tsukamurella paurometabola TaxID=2061 RepID=UPI001D1415B5|nr:YdcF family protein [Tsukamurella paurometabola]UEA83513.1 YdcF family protein [Tsukamurella paurometabola]